MKKENNENQKRIKRREEKNRGWRGKKILLKFRVQARTELRVKRKRPKEEEKIDI